MQEWQQYSNIDYVMFHCS